MRRIAQISDLHFGSHDPHAADDLLASLALENPNLVVLSGDFTQRALKAEFAEAVTFLGKIPQPKLVVPGNHDVPLYNLIGRFGRPLKNFRRFISPLGLAGDVFQDDEIAFLGLNTARRFPGKSGRVSFEQVRQIGRTFQSVPENVFKAVVTHHPLGYPAGEKASGIAGRSRHVLKVLADLDVHLLFSGHGHRPLSGALQTAEHRSILVLHAGTAISTRTRDGHGNTYNLIDIDGTGVSIRIMEWQEAGGFRQHHKSDYRIQDGQWRRL